MKTMIFREIFSSTLLGYIFKGLMTHNPLKIYRKLKPNKVELANK